LTLMRATMNIWGEQMQPISAGALVHIYYRTWCHSLEYSNLTQWQNSFNQVNCSHYNIQIFKYGKNLHCYSDSHSLNLLYRKVSEIQATKIWFQMNWKYLGTWEKISLWNMHSLSLTSVRERTEKCSKQRSGSPNKNVSLVQPYTCFLKQHIWTHLWITTESLQQRTSSWKCVYIIKLCDMNPIYPTKSLLKNWKFFGLQL
jgi:hypothetical protein